MGSSCTGRGWRTRAAERVCRAAAAPTCPLTPAPPPHPASPHPGVDKIGVSIEEPFSILALEVIAGTALANVRELVAMHEDTAAGVAAAANGNGGAAGAPAEADVSAAHMVTLAGAAA